MTGLNVCFSPIKINIASLQNLIFILLLFKYKIQNLLL